MLSAGLQVANQHLLPVCVDGTCFVAWRLELCAATPCCNISKTLQTKLSFTLVPPDQLYGQDSIPPMWVWKLGYGLWCPKQGASLDVLYAMDYARLPSHTTPLVTFEHQELGKKSETLADGLGLD